MFGLHRERLHRCAICILMAREMDGEVTEPPEKQTFLARRTNGIFDMVLCSVNGMR